MGLLSKLFGRNTDSADVAVDLDVEARRRQLQTLEESLDGLTRMMRERSALMENPGWRAKITEYDMVASEAGQLRKGTPTREAILDLAFQVRPAVTGPAAEGLDELVVQQDAALGAANALIDLLPGERQ
jgi:hypothetical protein